MTDHPAPISHREPAVTLLSMTWRTDDHTGRALYVGPKADTAASHAAAIGWMDTHALAAAVVTAVNGRQDLLDILQGMRHSSSPIVQRYYRALCTAFAVSLEELP